METGIGISWQRTTEEEENGYTRLYIMCSSIGYSGAMLRRVIIICTWDTV